MVVQGDQGIWDFPLTVANAYLLSMGWVRGPSQEGRARARTSLVAPAVDPAEHLSQGAGATLSPSQAVTWSSMHQRGYWIVPTLPVGKLRLREAW